MKGKTDNRKNMITFLFDDLALQVRVEYGNDDREINQSEQSSSLTVVLSCFNSLNWGR